MRKLFILAVTLILGLSMVSNLFAVSQAAVLFLMISPGARASGMGEAFVAVADDATAAGEEILRAIYTRHAHVGRARVLSIFSAGRHNRLTTNAGFVTGQCSKEEDHGSCPGIVRKTLDGRADDR